MFFKDLFARFAGEEKKSGKNTKLYTIFNTGKFPTNCTAYGSNGTNFYNWHTDIGTSGNTLNEPNV